MDIMCHLSIRQDFKFLYRTWVASSILLIKFSLDNHIFTCPFSCLIISFLINQWDRISWYLSSCCAPCFLFVFFFFDFFLIFFIYVGVRASLRAPRLISRPTEHPANPVDMQGIAGVTGVHMRTRTQEQQEETSPSYRQAMLSVCWSSYW